MLNLLRSLPLLVAALAMRHSMRVNPDRPVPASESPRVARARSAMRWLLIPIYAAAGLLHIFAPHPFLSIMPAWVPCPQQVVLFTGLCEVAGSFALATRRLRRPAGVMLALYALCVWPANVQHAINDLSLAVPHLGWWYHAPRLALQPVIIWWALFAGQAIDWPFGRRG